MEGIDEFRRGWRPLSASFVGIGVSMVSLPYYSAGIFVRPLEQDFGWSRAEIGLAGLVAVVTLSLTAPIAGSVIDRFGIRSVATLSLLLYGIGLLALSQMSGSLTVYYLIVAGYTAVGVASTPLAFTRAVTAWFERHRGLALGLSLSSTGLAAVLLPMLMTPFVAEQGWRAGYQLMFAIVLLGLPVVWFWIRDNPSLAASSRNSTCGSTGNVGARTALRSRRFWLLGTMFLIVALAVSGLIASFIPLLLDRGFSPKSAGSFGAVLGSSIVVGRLVTGFAVDRLFAPRVAALVFIMAGLGCLMLALGGENWIVVTAIALGFAMGAEVDLLGYFTARYFGMDSYGRIYGSLYSMFTIGAGASPAIAGRIHDVSGSYDIALLGAAALLVVAGAMSLLLGPFPDQPTGNASAATRPTR